MIQIHFHKVNTVKLQIYGWNTAFNPGGSYLCSSQALEEKQNFVTVATFARFVTFLACIQSVITVYFSFSSEIHNFNSMIRVKELRV